jgi:hypothetical protein
MTTLLPLAKSPIPIALRGLITTAPQSDIDTLELQHRIEASLSKDKSDVMEAWTCLHQAYETELCRPINSVPWIAERLLTSSDYVDKEHQEQHQ